MSTYDAEYFNAETCTLREVWGLKTNWIPRREGGKSRVELAFHAWAHLALTLLPPDEHEKIKHTFVATVREYAARTSGHESLVALDEACEGDWDGMAPSDRAFNLGYRDAHNGANEPVLGFAEFYQTGQDAYMDAA